MVCRARNSRGLRLHLLLLLVFLGGCSISSNTGTSPQTPTPTDPGLVNGGLQLQTGSMAIFASWGTSSQTVLDLREASLDSLFYGEVKSGETTCNVKRKLFQLPDHYLLISEGGSAKSWRPPFVDCRGKDVGLCGRMMAKANAKASMDAAIHCGTLYFSQKIKLISSELLEVCEGTNCQTLTVITPDRTFPDPQDSTTSAPVLLEDKTTYRDLISIAGNIVTPIIGDVRASLRITNSPQQAVEGTLRLAFEDKSGLWVADLVSVPKSGVNTASNLDILFTDDALTFRISSSRLGDNLLSNIYYRVRQAGENQCLPSKCYVTFGGVRYEVPFGSQWCPIAEPDTVNICRDYMNPNSSNAAVKKLGSFSSKYQDVVASPE